MNTKHQPRTETDVDTNRKEGKQMHPIDPAPQQNIANDSDDKSLVESLMEKVFPPKERPIQKLLAITPPRTGERTLLGVENMLQSIAVPEPFSLEIVGDAAGVTLMARCRERSVVEQQISVHYPQAPHRRGSPREGPAAAQ